MRTLVAVALIALTGCAPKLWAKRGGTLEQWQTDKYACEHDNQRFGCYMGSCGWHTEGRMYADCLRARGWELTDRTQVRILK